jgi:hypothetical protein
MSTAPTSTSLRGPSEDATVVEALNQRGCSCEEFKIRPGGDKLKARRGGRAPAD